MKFKHRFLYTIGFPISFIMLIPLLLIWFPLIFISSGIWWLFTNREFEWLYDKPIDWTFDLPFRISKYFEYYNI